MEKCGEVREAGSEFPRWDSWGALGAETCPWQAPRGPAAGMSPKKAAV